MLQGLGREHQVEGLVGIGQSRQVLGPNPLDDLARSGPRVVVRRTESRKPDKLLVQTPSMRLISAIEGSEPAGPASSPRATGPGQGRGRSGRARGSPGPCVVPCSLAPQRAQSLDSFRASEAASRARAPTAPASLPRNDPAAIEHRGEPPADGDTSPSGRAGTPRRGRGPASRSDEPRSRSGPAVASGQAGSSDGSWTARGSWLESPHHLA